MTPTRTITVEALAAALHACDIPPSEPYRSTPERDLIGHAKDAAAIFAALPAEPAGAGLREAIVYLVESWDLLPEGYNHMAEFYDAMGQVRAALAATPVGEGEHWRGADGGERE